MDTPDRKVTVGLFATYLMTLVAWASDKFLGVPITAEVALAGSGIIVFLVQYFVPNKGAPNAPA